MWNSTLCPSIHHLYQLSIRVRGKRDPIQSNGFSEWCRCLKASVLEIQWLMLATRYQPEPIKYIFIAWEFMAHMKRIPHLLQINALTVYSLFHKRLNAEIHALLLLCREKNDWQRTELPPCRSFSRKRVVLTVSFVWCAEACTLISSAYRRLFR